MKLKKVLSLVLAVAMVLSTIGTTVFAESPAVAQIGSDTYATLKGALDAVTNEKAIVIDLIDDATLDINAWDTLAIGGDTTETITINGNNKTLTFNQLNSDWNNIATNGAKLILNDMTITNSGHNDGPWNRYDINFACDVELNNVTASKAMAFKAGATLNKVTVNESGDNYAIWIQANGQTVTIDGLTVNSAGRGIKIDEQYVTAQKVTLSVKNAVFATEKKAAILVDSSAGAEITANNVDITNVKADNNNIVWVDSDSEEYYNEVTLNDEAVALEGQVAKVDGVIYTDIQEAIKAAAPSGTVEVVADATVDRWAMFTEDYTIGSDKLITMDMNGLTINGNGHTLTVKSVESASNGNYLFQGAENLNIYDWTIVQPAGVGGIALKSGTIEGVTFIGGNGVFPGTGEITINECEFKTDVYCIYYEDARDNLLVTNNTFEVDPTNNVILLRGHEQFSGNTVLSGRTVNAVSGAPVIDNNTFADGVRLKVYNACVATITNNTLTYITFHDSTEVKSTFANNDLSAEAYEALKAMLGNVDETNTIKPQGKFNSGINSSKITDADNPEKYRERFGIELQELAAKESVVVKIFAGEDLLATTSRREFDRDDETVKLFPVAGTTTVNVVVAGRLAGSWDTVWEETPNVNAVPTKLELWVDGVLVDTRDEAFGSEENKNDYIELPAVEAVAKIGETKFASLQDAINAAGNGDTVTLFDDVTITDTVVIAADDVITLDLNGKTISGVKSEKLTKNYEMILISKGNLTIEDSSAEKTGKITFEYKGASTNYGNYANTISNAQGTLTVNGGTIENTTNVEKQISYAIDNLTNGGIGDATLTVNGGKISSQYYIAVRAFANSDSKINTIVINDGEFYGRVQLHDPSAKTNKAVITIKDGTFTANEKVEHALYLYGYGDVSGFNVSVSGGTFNGVVSSVNGQKDQKEIVTGFITGGLFSTDVSEYLAKDLELIQHNGMYGVAGITATSKKIFVDFVATSKKDVYDIVLTGANNDNIYEFVSAEFTFANNSKTTTGATMHYELTGDAANKIVIIENTEKADTYGFHLADDATRPTANKITLGQVKFIGNGTIDFTVKDGTVVATVYETTLEDVYTVADKDLIVGTKADSTVDHNIYKNLIVNIDFKHVVESGNSADYNDMVVTVTGPFNYEKTVKVGNIPEVPETGVAYVDVVDNIFTYAFGNVIAGNRYTVKITAPGYRTATHQTTIEAESDKVLNFWNDAKKATEVNGVVVDPELSVEEGRPTMKANFLAGDIAMDYIVDKYDLAAVTSYYGTYDVDAKTATEQDKFVKYDLNRDGDIDILDVAYVIHSLNN